MGAAGIKPAAFAQQLRKLGIQVMRQDEYQVFYKDKLVGIQRLDLFVAKEVVVELKVVPKFWRSIRRRVSHI